MSQPHSAFYKQTVLSTAVWINSVGFWGCKCCNLKHNKNLRVCHLLQLAENTKISL